jgi:protein-disulfide isomerase
MFHEDKQGNLVLSPRASFALGLIGGVLVLCTLGFFILLGVVMKGGMPEGKKAAVKPSAAAPSVAAPSAAAPTAAPEPSVGEVAPVTDADHMRGELDDYEVTLVEYSDFECPFCSRFHSTMLELMDDTEYAGKVRWVYRHFPLSFHANARPAALASECAAEQGEFWSYADSLFSASSLSASALESMAEDLGLNMSKFKSCFSSDKYGSDITEDQNGGSMAGVSGTPGTIIMTNDGRKELIPGALPLEQVKGMIDAVLQ